MNLDDREIIELNELCGAVVDGTLTDAQRARLSQLLRDSEAARRFYVRALGQSAALHSYAAEMHAEAPDHRSHSAAVIRWKWRVAGVLMAAAAIAFGVWTINFRPAANEGTNASRRGEFVARLTAAKALRWGSGATALAPGAYLRRGERLEMSSGYVEITFDCGARVVLEGAASLDVNSAWDTTLRRGTLKATVPPEAIGFRVANTAVDVVDLGTEFTMIADGTGAAEVLVLKGEVEAAPRATGDANTILLRENEARRFEPGGVSEVADSDRKFALFAQPVTLERFSPTTSYVHWSLDEAAGEIAQADVAGGGKLQPASAQLALVDATSPATAHVDGRYGRALRFDGRLYARADVPGLSGSSPRTVALWVRVPEEAQPADTWMVSWATTQPNLGRRPVQISWNRRPAEGALGALRTDFGGGHAIGTTSLRDGRWHHVAVYFAAAEISGALPQVKQYVDGRLESSTIVPGTVRAPGGTGDMAVTDVVWLGYRLTGKQEGRRFRGDIDELFIADRALEPNEIVALMRDNRPPNTTLVSSP